MIIDDSFIDESLIHELQSAIYSESSPILWTLNHRTNLDLPNNPYTISGPETYSVPQMVSPVDPRHPAFHKIMNIFNAFVQKHNIAYSQVMRIKINLLFKNENPSGLYHIPHIDSDGPHNVFIYYVSDSDGDTVLFKENYNGVRPQKLNEERRISPKAGRALMFNGFQYHASSSPSTSDFRCIVNVDFI